MDKYMWSVVSDIDCDWTNTKKMRLNGQANL